MMQHTAGLDQVERPEGIWQVEDIRLGEGDIGNLKRLRLSRPIAQGPAGEIDGGHRAILYPPCRTECMPPCTAARNQHGRRGTHRVRR